LARAQNYDVTGGRRDRPHEGDAHGGVTEHGRSVRSLRFSGAALFSLLASAAAVNAQEKPIVHDAQYYILDAQNGERWAAEDKDLDARLAALRQKYGRPPNIIHLMWDDQPFGAVGIPALQQIRGYATPNLNQMAAEGMLFTRMYSQPSCTPTRDAAMTGQIPVRNGMYKVGFPIEYKGLSKNTVTSPPCTIRRSACGTCRAKPPTPRSG
jgi:arylsulfatase